MEKKKKPKPDDYTKENTKKLFAKYGFSSLTEIQKKASPVILQKRDCLVIAPTGSGKTECSVIPIFSLLGKTKKPDKIRALYITPLRALNRDVFRRIIKYAHFSDLSIAIRHGDTTQRERKRIKEHPPDILVTTPETLVILLSQPVMLTALYYLEWVIIDEVHELLPSERGAQLALSLERLELNSKRPLTRIGLSATVGNPIQAAKFVSGTKRRCKILKDTSVRKYDVDIVYVDGSISDVAEHISQHVTTSHLDSPILLFANTRGEAEFLTSALLEMSSIPVELHHGSLSREVREDAERILREGKGCRIVVCTSSLELGLDIGSVELVIHYGSPRQVSKFAQRIGRSRHTHGTSAQGLIVTNNPDDEFEARAILSRIRAGSIENQRMHDGSLDVLAHHMVGLTMQVAPKRIPVSDALTLAKRSYPFRNLSLDDMVDVLSQLDSIYLISLDMNNDMSFGRGGRSIRYHFENLSTIPDILKFKVFDSVGKRAIGSLDQRFVGDYGEQGNVFVLRGSQWRILNVDEKGLVVNVEPLHGAGGSSNNTKTVPYWEGETIPVDHITAKKVATFRSMVKHGTLKVVNKAVDTIHFEMPIFADDDDVEDYIAVESHRTQGMLVLHCCFGTRINSTLSTLLSSMLSGLLGTPVDSRSDAYRIVLSSQARITKERLLEVLSDEYDLKDIVSASLAGTHNVNWRTWCVAKKFGIVGRGAVYEKKFARFLYERYTGTALVREALRELFHDKYDLDGCSAVLKRIRQNQTVLSWVDVSTFSKLAEPILDHTSRYYSSPASLDKGILDLVYTRLEKTRHRLICARCGRWERVIETCEITDAWTPFCPYCKGRQITATFHSDYDLPGIIRKQQQSGKLTIEERKKFERAWKVSSLIETFGKTAIIVISGYGVGADTAARILRNMIPDDKDLLIKQIYEAERQYVVTRGFWD